MSASVDWFHEQEVKWLRLERKFGALVIQFAIMTFGGVLGIMVEPVPLFLTVLIAILTALSFVMLNLCAIDLQGIRRWVEWHQQIRGISDPCDWPLMPSHR